MASYCTAPDHINDEVDARIMSRHSDRKDTPSNKTLNNPHFYDTIETPWEYTVDKNGAEISGKEAMDRWTAATEEFQGTGYVAKKTGKILIEPITGEHRAANSLIDVPLNETGLSFSKEANLERLLRTAIFDDVYGFNPETAALVKLVASKGYGAKGSITGIGIHYDKTAFAQIIYDALDRYITIEKDYHRIAELHAKEDGIDTFVGRMYEKLHGVWHEMIHNMDVHSEYKVGMIQNEFYEMMAERYKGTEKEAVFRALAERAKEYAENSKGHRGRALSKYVSKMLKEDVEKDDSDEGSNKPNSKGKANKSDEKENKDEECPEQDGPDEQETDKSGETSESE